MTVLKSRQTSPVLQVEMGEAKVNVAPSLRIHRTPKAMNHLVNPENYQWVMECPSCQVEGTFRMGKSNSGVVICNACGATTPYDTLKERAHYRLREDAAKDGKQTLLREFKSVKNLQARLGNAIALAKASPENLKKDELMACLLDIRKLAEKIRADLEADINTYGL